ncbi:MAG TPA: hemagglutinin, partial [Paraburkholderia sp.]
MKKAVPERRAALEQAALNGGRRRIVQGATALGALAAIGPRARSALAQEQASRHTDFKGKNLMFAYVGSRTTRERNARGDGISVYRADTETGALEFV